MADFEVVIEAIVKKKIGLFLSVLTKNGIDKIWFWERKLIMVQNHSSSSTLSWL